MSYVVGLLGSTGGHRDQVRAGDHGKLDRGFRACFHHSPVREAELCQLSAEPQGFVQECSSVEGVQPV